MAMQTGPGGKVDRQTTTPFHLKLFYRTGSFHNLGDFPLHPPTPTTHPPAPLPPHLQIYTWPTCTLRELSHLLTSALPTLLPSPAIGTRIAYRLLYPDTRSGTSAAGQGQGRYLSKELGDIIVGGEGARDSEENGGSREGEGGGEKVIPPDSLMGGVLSGDPEKTLQEARFVIGDFISCAVFAPGVDGSVAPARGSGGGGRGYGGEGGGFRGGRGGDGRGGDFGGGRGYGGENGGFRGRGRGGFGGGFNGVGRGAEGGVPMGEWRRGERVPEGRSGYGRGRGRGF